MRPATHALLALSIIALAFTTGCQPATNPAPRPGLADPYPAPMNDPDITVVDEDLRQWLGFQPAVRTRAQGQPMRIEVPVRNLADQSYLIEYRFLFFDANGMELLPTMGWTFENIEPKAVARLRANALGPEAMTYKLEVRWAR